MSEVLEPAVPCSVCGAESTVYYECSDLVDYTSPAKFGRCATHRMIDPHPGSV